MRYKFLRYPGGKPKAATFSYDDGVKTDVRFAQTLAKYGIKCTFNFNSFSMRGDGGISVQEAKDVILGNGHEIAVHGFNHRAEGTLRPIEGIREVLDNRLELEKTFGIIIRGMAYPDSGITYFTNGANYPAVRQYLSELDVCYCRTLGGDNNKFDLPSDWLAWMPTAHHKNPKTLDYIDEFIALDISTKSYCARRQPRLLYIWGHTYEFNNDNNWELVDAMCQRLAACDDIWFATNMEIYEYVNAYNALIFSADCSIVRNPSCLDIWLDIDGKVFCIKAGETVTF